MAKAEKETGEERSYEKIGGKFYALARPVPNHSRVVFNIERIFAAYLKGKRCTHYSEIDVHLDEDNTLVPDVLILCDRKKLWVDGVHGAPDLVAEVLSPSTTKRDRMEKMSLYEKFGVREYWLVSYENKTVEVYKLWEGKFSLDNVYCLYPEWEWRNMTEEEKNKAEFHVKVSLYDDFLVDLREIFADLWLAGDEEY